MHGRHCIDQSKKTLTVYKAM